MTALRTLVGVECIPCRRKGHRCQAQLRAPIAVLRSGEEVVRDEPMCLRCADGEACCFETAAALELGAWREEPEEAADLCRIPRPTGSDLEFVRALGKPESLHAEGGRRGAEKRLRRYPEEMKAAMLDDLKSMTTQEVADKWDVPRGTVGNLRSNVHAKLLLKVRKMTRESHLRQIRGEAVRMAPLASMGAEMLDGQDFHKM